MEEDLECVEAEQKRESGEHQIDQNEDEIGAKLLNDCKAPTLENRFRNTGNSPENVHPLSRLELIESFHQQLLSVRDLDPDAPIRVETARGEKELVKVADYRATLLKEAKEEFSAVLSQINQIDQRKLSRELIGVVKQIDSAKTPEAKSGFESTKSQLESMKLLPVIVHFRYAAVLSDCDDFKGAREHLFEASKHNELVQLEAYDRKIATLFQTCEANKLTLSESCHRISELERVRNQALAQAECEKALADLRRPQETVAAALSAEKEAPQWADELYRQAIEQASIIDPRAVELQIDQLTTLSERNINNAERQREIELGRYCFEHQMSLIRTTYAEFLTRQGHHESALAQLLTVEHEDPSYAAERQDFLERKLCALAGTSKGVSDPSPHLRLALLANSDSDRQKAAAEFDLAIATADKISSKLMIALADRAKKLVVQGEFKELKVPLDMLAKNCAELAHAPAFARICKACFALEIQDFEAAKSLLDEARKLDPNFVGDFKISSEKGTITFDHLLSSAEKPSWLKSIAADLACDAVAMGVGTITAATTSLSGPGAIGAATITASAAYTFMKGVVMGEPISWTTPLWGALDGIAGASSALVRASILKSSSEVLSKRGAEFLLKSGYDMTKTAGMSSKALFETAKQVAKNEVKSLSKDLTLTTRFLSKVPCITTGVPEYRAAFNTYLTLNRKAILHEFKTNALSAGTASLIYRGGQELGNYSRTSQSLFKTSCSYAAGVVSDSLNGGLLLAPLGRLADCALAGSLKLISPTATKLSSSLISKPLTPLQPNMSRALAIGWGGQTSKHLFETTMCTGAPPLNQLMSTIELLNKFDKLKND